MVYDGFTSPYPGLERFSTAGSQLIWISCSAPKRGAWILLRLPTTTRSRDTAACGKRFEQLELLEKLNRILPEEQARLREYRRLLDKILVLAGL